MGRKLGDGSYVPAPARPPCEQLAAARPSTAEENSSALAAAAQGTIAEFDLPKILRHIAELNYLVRRLRSHSKRYRRQNLCRW